MTVVKQGPHRIVYRVQLASGAIYQQSGADPQNSASPVGATQQGVPRIHRGHQDSLARGSTVQPLGFARLCGLLGNGESMLITRSLDDTQPLNEFLHQVLPTFAARRQVKFRQRLAAALGQFMVRMHLAGIRYNDLHAGNLLLRLHADDTMELFLIDLNDIHFGACLTWRQCFDNLVILNIWFVLQVVRSDRLRFLLGYLRARLFAPRHEPRSARFPPALVGPPPGNRDLAGTAQALAVPRPPLPGRQSVLPTTPDAAHAIGHAVADLDPKLGAALLADPDGPFRDVPQFGSRTPAHRPSWNSRHRSTAKRNNSFTSDSA